LGYGKTSQSKHEPVSRTRHSANVAHASTQHSTSKQLVKLRALIVSTDKNEIMASAFAIALNHFMEEYTDKEDTHNKEEPVNQPGEAATRGAEDGDAPQQRKLGNTRIGKKIKLFDLQQVASHEKQKGKRASGGCKIPWTENWLKRCKSIYKSLTSKEENLFEKAWKEKPSKLMACIDKTKPPNYWQRKQGEDLPPHLLGCLPYKPMGLKANLTKLEKS
jgi:hypothetical protein